MIAKKLLVVCGFAVAAVSANATITLTNGGTFTLGGAYSGLLTQPTYTPGSTTTSISLTSSTPGVGTLNDWWFSAVDDSGNLGVVNYKISATNVTPTSELVGLITVLPYNSMTGAVGQVPLLVLPESVSIASGTVTLPVDLSGLSTSTAFVEGDFFITNVVPEPTGVAALAIGALGLLVRRRRSK